MGFGFWVQRVGYAPKLNSGSVNIDINRALCAHRKLKTKSLMKFRVSVRAGISAEKTVQDQ